MTRTLLLVGIGGGLGSIFRHLTSLFINKHFQSSFPYATLTANILGCLLIGFLIGFFEKQQIASSDLKFLLITGFCGGYTTFSAFAAENINLFHSGNTLAAFAHIALSVIVCLLSVFIGISLTKFI